MLDAIMTLELDAIIMGVSITFENKSIAEYFHQTTEGYLRD